TSRRRHTRSKRDWSSDVCSSDLPTCHLLAHCVIAPTEHHSPSEREGDIYNLKILFAAQDASGLENQCLPPRRAGRIVEACRVASTSKAAISRKPELTPHASPSRSPDRRYSPGKFLR